MRHKRSSDKRRMKKKKDSVPGELNVQNEKERRNKEKGDKDSGVVEKQRQN